MAENATQPHDTRRPAETATISGRDRVADILSDLDRGRAEALEAVQAAEALRQAERAERKA